MVFAALHSAGTREDAVGLNGIDGLELLMSQDEAAAKMKICRQRAQQLEASALAKLRVLLYEHEVDWMDQDELRLLLEHTENAASGRARHPAYVEKRFLERVR